MQNGLSLYVSDYIWKKTMSLVNCTIIETETTMTEPQDLLISVSCEGQDALSFNFIFTEFLQYCYAFICVIRKGRLMFTYSSIGGFCIYRGMREITVCPWRKHSDWNFGWIFSVGPWINTISTQVQQCILGPLFLFSACCDIKTLSPLTPL